MKNFTIIIPIFNEIDSIFNLVDEIKKEFKGQIPEIIIVDDGSTDSFVIKKKGLTRITLELYTTKGIWGNVKLC